MKGITFISICLLATISSFAAEKNIALIAGAPSHGPGDHEFRAGCLLLQRILNEVPGIRAEVYDNGWPKRDAVFEDVDAVLIYSDGGGKHPALQGNRSAIINDLMKKGIGFGCAHYAVEVPAGETGKLMQDWIGGHYENGYSVNPMWEPDFKEFPKHPIANGVEPFQVEDEWYFNIRFRGDGVGTITPILVAPPSDDVREGPYVYPKGPYPHIVAESGRPEIMMWTYHRPDGGRSFGFTGGHRHVNWGNDNFRKIVLNALLWIAEIDVPEEGVVSSVGEEELKANLDKKKPR